MKGRISILVAALSMVAASTAPAATVTPVTAVESTHYIGNASTDNRSGTHTIDGSGLTGSQHDNNPTNANAPGFTGSMWLTNGVLTGNITYTLSSTEILGGMHVWNYNEANFNPQSTADYTLRGLKDVVVQFSTDGGGSFSAGEVVSLTKANGLTTYTGEDISFAAPVSANAVKLTIQTTYHGTDTGDPYAGLSEVRFTSVPEPTILSVLGLSAMGLLARRRGR